MPQKSINCACAHEIYLENFLDDVRDEALNNGELSDLEDEIECDECGSIYQVSASAYVHVDISIKSIELFSQGVAVNGETINIDQFSTGDDVALPDAQYQVGNMLYEICNGIISNIYNAQIDENQLELAI